MDVILNVCFLSYLSWLLSLYFWFLSFCLHRHTCVQIHAHSDNIHINVLSWMQECNGIDAFIEAWWCLAFDSLTRHWMWFNNSKAKFSLYHLYSPWETDSIQILGHLSSSLWRQELWGKFCWGLVHSTQAVKVFLKGAQDTAWIIALDPKYGNLKY